MEDGKRIVEIGGAKFEVDMRSAKRIDCYHVGDNVKVLVKEYGSTWKSFPGVIVGFDDFTNLPTITILYLETGYDPKAKLLCLNSGTQDVEICPMDEDLETVIKRAEVMEILDSAVLKAQAELLSARRKREYFLEHFGMVASDAASAMGVVGE